jgi:hypothetical protein
MRIAARAPGHAGRRGPRRSRVVLTGLGVAGVSALVAGLAYGYFVTTDSSHPASASATSLSAPSVGVAEASATSTTVSWSAGSQPPGTNYVVIRNPGAGQVTVCTVPASTSSCTDSGLSPGTSYSYSVTAGLDSWKSAAGTTSLTTMAVNVTSPTNGSTSGTNWSGSISGTSSPATGATIATVKASIQQGSGSCWTGTGNAWTAACPNYVATGGSVSSWTLSVPIGDLNSVNTYHITAEATDSSNISASTSSTFTFNGTAPIPAPPVASATTHSTDSNGVYWVNAETVTLTDSVTYTGAGTVSSVAYYYCPTSSCTGSNGTFIGNGSGGSWSYGWTGAHLPTTDGPYYVVAVATDSLTNAGTSPTAEIGVDRTPPNVSTPSVNGLS